MKIKTVALTLLILSSSAALAQSPSTTGAAGFYRFPTLSGETVVFAAEGDLWSVPVSGGLARRLTSHAAEETDPVEDSYAGAEYKKHVAAVYARKAIEKAMERASG